MKPYYVLRLDRVDDALPKGRVSVQMAVSAEEFPAAAQASLFRTLTARLEAWLAAHEQEDILRERLKFMPDWAWAEWVEQQGVGE